MESLCFITFILLTCLIYSTMSQYDCIFSDTSGSHHKLDLNSLRGKNITIRDDIAPGEYQYSVCENNFGCTYGDGSHMTGMINQKTGFQEGCATVAVFEAWTQPEYIQDEKKWRFDYENGHNCTYNASQPRRPRRAVIEWICNDDLDHDFEILAMDEPVTCVYHMV
eukprot:116925_1